VHARSLRILAGVVAGLVVVGAGAVYLIHKVPDAISSIVAAGPECSATVGGHTATLDPEQSRNAALIVAIAVHRGLPAHAATIALATAMQESKLYNLDYGDRDSVGLFQQRPSQGWGKRSQLKDPVYATNAFYDALVRVHDYADIPVTEAAQEVQHSGYPEAYAAHEADARALASALTGYSPHAFGCDIDAPKGSGSPTQMRDEVRSVFDAATVVRGSRATLSMPRHRTGWAVAQYLVAQASRFGIRSVAYAGHVWTAGDGAAWKSGGAAPGGELVVLFG
jgi:hypothetical protein